MLTIEPDRNGGEVAVALGEAIEFQMPENPTTGYRWHLRSAGEGVLELQNDSFEIPSGRCGAGGVRQWRFQAVHEGVATIEIDYRRSWEPEPIKTFSLIVIASPSTSPPRPS
jgi:inhibitor of cysteine peptidase